MREEVNEDEADAAYDLMMQHKPKCEDDINQTLVDCDPRLGSCTKDEFREAVEESRMWTMISAGDGLLYAEPGNHQVNAMSHHICEIPYHLVMVCPHCDSANITKDATVGYDVVEQDWVLEGTCDAGWCNDCDCEVRNHKELVIPLDKREGKRLNYYCIVGRIPEDENSIYVSDTIESLESARTNFVEWLYANSEADRNNTIKEWGVSHYIDSIVDSRTPITLVSHE